MGVHDKETIPQDTPIQRASILDMDEVELTHYIDVLQTRRLASWNIYKAGLEAKKRAKDERDAALLDKALTRFLKLHETVERQLGKLDKLATEIRVARLAATGEI